MRITFVLPTVDFSGGMRVVATYADRLQRLGHEVACVSVVNRGQPFKRRVKSLLTGGGWPTSPSKPKSHFDFVDVPHTIVQPFRPIAERDVPDADVIVATWFETAHWISKMSPRKGAKAYFVQHHEAMFAYVDKTYAAATYKLPMQKITISRWLEALLHEYGEEEVSLVPNSVDSDQFQAPPRGKQARPTIGFMHSNVKLKGAEVVLKAIARLREQLPDLRVLAFGLQQPAEHLSLPPGAEFVHRPAQDKIKDVYAQCDAWLCGSVSEGFHLPPLEAMACRCPVVSTRVGGPVDVIEEGVNGHLVQVDDVDALATKTARVLNLPLDQWQSMSDAAYHTATRYTWDDATLHFEAALQRTVNRFGVRESQAALQTA